MAGDLHVHSTFSDGSVPVKDLPLMAKRLGLSTLAVSDHDSLKSVRFAMEHPVQEGVALIPAAELSAYDYQRKRRAHLLAYWPKLTPALERHCAHIEAERNAAWVTSARELEAVYPQFRAEMALEYAKDSDVLYKSGIMQALCELGLVQGGIYGETYQKIFGKGGMIRRTPTYFSVENVLEILRESKAVVVFAHPSVYNSMELVQELAAAGRIDGIEVEHPRNTEADKAVCRALCERYDLILTGGTDFHGSNSKEPKPLGTCTTTEEQIGRIRALAAARHGEL